MHERVKGPFCDPQPHPPIFLQKVEIFILVETFRYIMFVKKIFLANLHVWQNYHRICVFFMSTWKFQHWPMQQCDAVKRG